MQYFQIVHNFSLGDPATEEIGGGASGYSYLTVNLSPRINRNIYTYIDRYLMGNFFYYFTN